MGRVLLFLYIIRAKQIKVICVVPQSKHILRAMLHDPKQVPEPWYPRRENWRLSLVVRHTKATLQYNVQRCGYSEHRKSVVREEHSVMLNDSLVWEARLQVM